MKNLLLTATLFVALSNCSVAQSLDDYVKIALENNPGLQAQREQVEAALQRIPQAGALPDPTFSVSAFGEMVETRVGQQQARLSLSQMFPWFGTLGEAKDAAAFAAEASYQSYLSARNELIFRVSAAYYPLWELDEMIRIQKRNMEILSSYKSLATVKFQNGTGQMADALRVDIMTNELAAEIRVLELSRRPLLVAFNNLLNRSPEEPVSFPSEMTDRTFQDFSIDSVMNRNPMIDKVEQNIAMAQAQQRLAKKKSMPNLGVGFEYIVVDARPDMSFEGNGKDAYMPMFTVSLPIFRKKYRAAINEAQYTEQAFVAEKRSVENELVAEYHEALAAGEKALELVGLFEEQREETRRVINLLLTGYRNNTVDFQEILMMQQAILKYEMEEIKALANLRIAEAKLNYLMAKEIEK